MSEFLFKTYRCEWVTKIVWVDQYDRPQKDEPPLYECAWPTQEEAAADLARVATLQPNGRWIGENAYQFGKVVYREVEVILPAPDTAPTP